MARRIVDLSYPITAGMPVYPGDAEVEFVWVSEIPDAECNLTRFSMSAHAGTHVDAPYHFVSDGGTVDQLALSALTGPARVLDMGELEADTLIDVDMLAGFADRVSEGSRILLRTGWGRRFGRDDFFSHQPDITHAAAEWFVDRRIALLGIEQPSLSAREDAAIHRVVLGAGIVVIENLANLHLLSGPEVELLALPLNLAGRDGAPARVVAIENSER